MVKFAFFCVLVFLSLFVLFHFITSHNASLVIHPVTQSSDVSPTPVLHASSEFNNVLFVPYWTLDDTPIDSYDALLYFGIAPDDTGINKEDIGYKKLDTFLKNSSKTQERLLTVRMLDSKFNSDILENTSLQKKIIMQSIQTAKDYNFTGIVLDFELAALSFDSVIKKITLFHQDFSVDSKNNALTFGMTMYGDVFYRMRPYDVKTLAKYADTMYLMAYDFHKARENPGPNFPLAGKSTYGYDMEMMATDFLAVVPAQKLVVVFGMFGYDWIVDRRGASVENATSLSWLKAQKQFISSCHFKNCTVERSPLSAETTVTYIDEERRNHIVWFEDMESVAAKKKYLQSRGITNFGYWAYSYF